MSAGNGVSKHRMFRFVRALDHYDTACRLFAPALDYYDGAACKKIKISERLSAIEVIAPGANQDHIILHFHGGAHCFGSVWGTRELVGRMSAATQARIISVDYRLAPENPFPAGLEDAYTAWNWVRAQYPHASVAVAGDSAGGNLAFALLVKLSQLRETQPVACVTMSPWLLLTTPGTGQRDPSAQSRMQKVWDHGARKMASQYCQGYDASDPLVSPVLATNEIVERFPPVLIHAAEKEPLVDDARSMAGLCERCGVRAELELFPSNLHCFQVVPMKEASKESLRRMNLFLQHLWTPSVDGCHAHT